MTRKERHLYILNGAGSLETNTLSDFFNLFCYISKHSYSYEFYSIGDWNLMTFQSNPKGKIHDAKRNIGIKTFYPICYLW